MSPRKPLSDEPSSQVESEKDENWATYDVEASRYDMSDGEWEFFRRYIARRVQRGNARVVETVQDWLAKTEE